MINGALLIDKPAESTSRQVVNYLSRITKQKKIGHAGTLDPMATGLLVVMFGKAARLQSLFLEASKSYEGSIVLGKGTDTDDITGRVVAVDEVCAFEGQFSENQLIVALRQRFEGEQMQIPPQYSAIKLSGTRSYILARRNEEVVHQPRKVKIEIQELRWAEKRELYFRTRVSKGTYLRAFARDIGAMLQSCACLKSLRRLTSEPFSLNDAVSLEAMQTTRDVTERILSLDCLIRGLPKLPCSEQERLMLRVGNQTPLFGLSLDSPAGQAALIDTEGSFFGLIERTSIVQGEKEPEEESPAAQWKIKFLL